MRGVSMMADLTARAAHVAFPDRPVYDGTSFEVWTSKLRRLLRDNDLGPGEDFDWDAAKQCFSWRVTAGRSLTLADGTAVFMQRWFTLDPRLPIAEEFARLRREHDVFGETQITAARALVAIGGKV